MKVIYRFLVAVNVVLYLFAIIVGIVLGQQQGFVQSLYSLHFQLSLGAAVLTLFIHSLLMIYFIVTHKAVKEGLDDRGISGTEFRDRMRELKMETIPWTTMGMLMIIGATIVGAAVDTGHLPRWSHSSSVLFAIFVNLYLFWLSHEKLTINTDLMHEANQLLLEYDDRETPSDEENSET